MYKNGSIFDILILNLKKLKSNQNEKANLPFTNCYPFSIKFSHGK